jgi:hypothetical protein
VLLKEIGLQRLAADIGGGRRHVHHFAGRTDRQHLPEQDALCRGPERDLPAIRLDHIHDEGRYQHHDERRRPEQCRRIEDIPGTDTPNEEPECEETDNKEN